MSVCPIQFGKNSGCSAGQWVSSVAAKLRMGVSARAGGFRCRAG